MRYKILIAIILSVVVCSYVSAEPRSSTPEEYKKALSYSVDALRKTDNYATSLANNNDSFNEILNGINKCEYEYKRLETIQTQHTIGGKEALNCIFTAMIILQERQLALTYLKDSIYAKVQKDESTARYYLNKSKEYKNSADSLRQEFKVTYGY